MTPRRKRIRFNLVCFLSINAEIIGASDPEKAKHTYLQHVKFLWDLLKKERQKSRADVYVGTEKGLSLGSRKKCDNFVCIVPRRMPLKV